jgi:hypothetical protein
VAIVVQKEDFLRRDVDVLSYPSWRGELHKLYGRLRPFELWDFEETYPGQQEDDIDYNNTAQSRLFNASGEYQFYGSAVRCIGYAKDQKKEITPILHHKYLIFGDIAKSLIMRPRCVVSGSFNLTKNAARSRENVMLVEDRDICQAFLSEWAQLWCVSESLNWDSPEPTTKELDMST